MAELYVTSTSARAGKTLYSASVAKNKLENNESVYYINLGTGETDKIIEEMSESYGTDKLEYQYIIKDELDDSSITAIVSDKNKLFDSVIIDGSIGDVANIQEPSDAAIVVIHDCSLGVEFELALIANYADHGSVSILFNKIPKYKFKETALIAQACGATVIGTITEDRSINGLAFDEIMQCLNGKLIDLTVTNKPYIEKFLIGGNMMDSGKEYFGRYQNQAVITRSGRPDIQMSSIMAGTRCLILTGSAEPTEYIISEARKHRVPMIHVESSTETTVNMLSGAFGDNPVCIERVDRFAELLVSH